MSQIAINPQLTIPSYRGARDFEIWLAVGSSVLVLAILFLSGQGQLLRLAIPATGTLVGFVLYLRRPILYIQYALWVWFLCPLIRRLVDWRFGWMDPNFVLLTPLLVSGIAGMTLLRRSSNQKDDGAIPPAFVLCGVAILYGFVVGIVQRPSAETVYGLFNWLCPLLFGFHLYRNWPLYKEQRDAISKTFLWAVLLLGLYGVYQFFAPPAWDIYWVQSVTNGLIDQSFGQPEPLLIRVWSALNAPGPFANVLTVGLLLILTNNSPLRFPAAVAGALALLLSGVRTAWMCGFIGFLVILRHSRPSLFVRALLTTIALTASLLLLASDPRIAPVIEDRLETFHDIGHDASFDARLDMYRQLVSDVENNPFGFGLSNAEVSHGYALDSGILATIFSLGWLGTLLFGIGIISILFSQRRLLEKSDGFLRSGSAIIIAILAQLVGGNIFVSVTGALFWVFVGMSLGGSQCHRRLQIEPAGRKERVLVWKATIIKNGSLFSTVSEA